MGAAHGRLLGSKLGPLVSNEGAAKPVKKISEVYQMFQESGTWDLRNMLREPSTNMQIYTFFLFVPFISTCVKLVRVWRLALPFRLSQQVSSPEFLVTLETSASSLKQWIGCTLLAWGMLTSLSVTDFSTRLISENGRGSLVSVFLAQDLSTALMMALIVMLFAFLARWHMLKRIEYLRNFPNKRQGGKVASSNGAV